MTSAWPWLACVGTGTRPRDSEEPSDSTWDSAHDSRGETAGDSTDSVPDSTGPDSGDSGDSGDPPSPWPLVPTVKLLGHDPYDGDSATLVVGPVGAEPLAIGWASPSTDYGGPEVAAGGSDSDTLSTVRFVAPPWTGGDVDAAAFAVVEGDNWDTEVQAVALAGDLDLDGLAEVAVKVEDDLYFMVPSGAFDPEAVLAVVEQREDWAPCATPEGPCGLAVGPSELGGDRLELYAGPWSGTMAPVATVELPGLPFPNVPVPADLDGDGLQDVVEAPYVLSLPSAGGWVAADLAMATLDPGPTSVLYSLVAGDLDGDGHADLVSNSMEVPDGSSLSIGPALAFLGPFDGGTRGPDLVVEHDFITAGGPAVADLDADGHDDLVWADTSYDRVGTVLVFAGPLGAATHSSDAPTVRKRASAQPDAFGVVVCPTDVNGLAGTDVVVSAFKDSDAGDRAGAVHVILGPELMAPE